MLSLKGIFPPIPTAFNQNGDLDPGRMKENLNHLSSFGLSGFLVLGSNGEMVMLSEQEKAKVYLHCREAIPGDKIMIAGTGGQSTRETLFLSLAAAEAGADAVLILHPYYYKGLMTQSALVNHYHEIAEACPAPVIIYNMPANSGMDLAADIIVAISDHPNIIGLKDSGGNLTKMGEIIHRSRDDFQVLAGSAGFLLPALLLGAIGGILALANIAPQRCLDIYKAFQNQEAESAQALQLGIIQLNNAVTRGWGVPALKAAMEYLGMYGGPCRKPIQPIDDETRERLVVLIDKCLNQRPSGDK